MSLKVKLTRDRLKGTAGSELSLVRWKRLRLGIFTFTCAEDVGMNKPSTWSTWAGPTPANPSPASGLASHPAPHLM